MMPEFTSTLPPEPERDFNRALGDIEKSVGELVFNKYFNTASMPSVINGIKRFRSITMESVFSTNIAITRTGILLIRHKEGKEDCWHDSFNNEEFKTEIRTRANRLADLRLDRQKRQYALHKTIDDLARYAHDMGISAHVVIPDDSSSRYLYLEQNNKTLKIRSADHAQPGIYQQLDEKESCMKWVPVGGYSKSLGTRYEAADLSIDPETKKTIRDAKILIQKTFKDAPREPLSTDDA